MKNYAGSNDAEVSRVLHNNTFSLYRITLPALIPGYGDFLTPWLLVHHGGGVFLVDPGPKATSEALISCLKRIGIESIDFVLLTHVHIDHAGGLHQVLDAYPSAKVVSHHKGQPHLADPSKLWKGSVHTLGELAEVYGEILPVEPDSIMSTDAALEIPHLSVIESPGHASHHQSYVLSFSGKRVLFVGEATGICYSREYFDGSTENGHEPAGFYLRPATPPKFFYDMTMESTNRLLDANADYACYGHYGFCSHPGKAIKAAQGQLSLWKSVLSPLTGKENPLETGISLLLKEDPLLDKFEHFSKDIQEREKYYIGNSILGFLSST